MNKGNITILVLLLLFSGGSAHEHWIDLEDFSPGVGDSVGIFICSGHYFPRSKHVLGDRLLCDMKVIGPGGKEQGFSTAQVEEKRAGRFVFDVGGTHIVTFSLRRPPLKEPEYRATSLVCVGDGESAETKFDNGTGLEIVPGKNPCALDRDEKLPLQLLYLGKPVGSTLSISIEGEKNFFLRTHESEPALLDARRPGKYLVTAHYRKKGCSLTFSMEN